ncbi:hypothetical protein M3N64_08620 [Sporolactobacillus sp. CPB3-1]|uniref:Uncharacterized protein n=1 Tax=Sporolactobacillus mangiferae TaxID=2940498 RepID=A0ABT0MAW3_9BACL|nr:hypothetical protein [Sporolactobacillus mangiferae]MCL1632011.1 hypothetical protein [Sporolactobacillus mangiferae]
MKNQYCMKPNVQMYLMWLFINLCRNILEACNVARVFVTSKNEKSLNDFAEPFQLTFHQLRMAVRFALDRRIVLSFSVAHNEYSSLRLKPILFVRMIRTLNLALRNRSINLFSTIIF